MPMNKTGQALLFVVALLSLAVFTPQAQAQSCNFSVTALNFGSIDILSNRSASSTATISINCSGSAWRNVIICPNIGDGSGGSIANGARRTMVSDGNRLQFQLYSDAGRTDIWGSYVWANPQRPPSYKLSLGTAGSATMSATIYGLVFENQTSLPAGNYISSFAGHTVFGYHYEATSPGCSASNSNQSGVAFTASANVPANCLIHTQMIDFGTTGILAGNVDAEGKINVTCTQGSDYTIALDNGQNGNGPTARQMAKGAERISYGLYRDPGRSQPWGSGSSEANGKGSSNSQSWPVYGRVPPQATPSAGIYSDIVVVTVSY